MVERVQREEAGFTLVELLVAMSLSIVVLLATLMIFDNGLMHSIRDTDRAQAAIEPMAGAAGMVRELRQAEDVVEMTGNAVDVIVSTRGSLQRVRYDCDVAFPQSADNPYDDTYRRCVRRAADATAGADPPALPALSTAQVVIDRMCPGTGTTCASAASAPVFRCRATDGTVAACAALPPAPVDPDDLPEPGDEAPDTLWPTSFEVRIDVPARGESRRATFGHRVSFTDGVFMRNYNREPLTETAP